MSESNRQRMELRKKVLDFLEGHDIPYELHTHPPLFTIEEGLKYWKNLDCTHCKNLFFRNHKGNRHYLVSMECHKLEQMIHEGKLSFASEERMVRCLGLHPGSVSAFGLINDIYIPSQIRKSFFLTVTGSSIISTKTCSRRKSSVSIRVKTRQA